MTLKEIEFYYNDMRSKQQLLTSQIEDKKQIIQTKEQYHSNLVKARWVLTEVVQQTQIRFKEHVENLVTKCIQSVFDRPFEFKLDFERKHNKIECRPYLEENGIIYNDIQYQKGGSMCDIIAFSFRVILWNLMNPKSRNVLLLDEPFRYLGDLTSKAAQMLREISHSLKIQVIMITHDDSLAEIADKSWYVKHNGTHSLVEET